MDKETAEVISTGEAFKDLVGSKGWELAKARLLQQLNLLNSISATVFENKTPDQIALEMQSRAAVYDIFIRWLQDVEGSAHQASQNNSTLHQEEEIILTLESE